MAPSSEQYASLLQDLADEHDALDVLVAPLVPDQWRRPTPSAGWAVRDQIGHLNHFDGTARLSAVDPAAFIAQRDEMMGSLQDLAGLDDATLAFARSVTPDELLGAWRRDRQAMLAAFAPLDPTARLEWYGPTMGAMSFATARLMETWAHGQDVLDTVGGSRPASDRLRHIADLGVRTRGFSYLIRGREVPAVPVRVELTAPSGTTWAWGPAEAPDRVEGGAEDFCLVVTQRRHVSDTGLVVGGDAAEEWMSIAQAFAGGPTPGRSPST